MYVIDCNNRSISDPTGKEIHSSVAWNFVAALYLQSLKSPQTGGKLSSRGLASFPYFSRYNANALRATIARSISTIETEFSIVGYTKKSTGPWFLHTPTDFSVSPSVRVLKELIERKADTSDRLHLSDESNFHDFATLLIEGDCLLHTGNQKEAALSAYQQAARAEHPLLKNTALIRLCHAQLRLGHFKQTLGMLDTTDWGEKNSYDYVQSLLLRAKTTHLMGLPSEFTLSADSILCPDDISVSAALTLDAYKLRDECLKLSERDGDGTRKEHLAKQCLEALLEAMLYRLRSFYYDGAQQSAYNIANTVFLLSQNTAPPLFRTDPESTILRWADLCRTVCLKFDLGQDSNLNELLLADTLANNPHKQRQALQIAHEAHAKSLKNNNTYDQQHLKALIYKLSAR